MDQDLSQDLAKAPTIDALEQDAAPAKFIRTYARDMAIVQKGGTPDLVPLAPPTAANLPTNASGVPTVAFAPQSAARAPQGAPPAQPPAGAVVTTFDKGRAEAVSRTQAAIATSPAGVSWGADAKEHEAILTRLEEKARAMNLPTKPAPPKVAIRATTPEAVLIAPPAGALSVPAYAPSFTLGVPGEPVPAPPPPPPMAPPPQPTVPPPSSPPPASPRPTPPAPAESPLHTYATDFSERVGESHASRAAILASEADARRTAPAPAPAARRARGGRGRLYLSTGLVVVGLALVYGAYSYFIAHTSPVKLAFAPSAPIFVDEQEAVSGGGPALMSAIVQASGRPLPDGSMRLLYNPSATSTSIFSALELPAPDVLLRNVNAAGSMAGIVSTGGEQTPFFVLSVSSYGDTFAGMLAWEPSMVRALSSLYPARTDAVPVLPDADASTTASTTSAWPRAPALTAPSAQEGFSDEVVANHDTRVYRDSENRTILIYGYWDQSTLVIARDEAAFSAIVSRLATSKSASS